MTYRTPRLRLMIPFCHRHARLPLSTSAFVLPKSITFASRAVTAIARRRGRITESADICDKYKRA